MSADARTLLRESPMSAFQIMVVVICTLLNMIDGFDVLAISFTAPVIAKEWGVAPATLGILLSAGLAGMALGSLALSPLADLMGRRGVIVVSTAIISNIHPTGGAICRSPPWSWDTRRARSSAARFRPI
jgi:MFS family permease